MTCDREGIHRINGIIIYFNAWKISFFLIVWFIIPDLLIYFRNSGKIIDFWRSSTIISAKLMLQLIKLIHINDILLCMLNFRLFAGRNARSNRIILLFNILIDIINYILYSILLDITVRGIIFRTNIVNVFWLCHRMYLFYTIR